MPKHKHDRSDDDDDRRRPDSDDEIEYERTVNIRELDLNDLPPRDEKDVKNGLRLIMIGKPGSGKSEVIKAILYAKKHIIPVGHVFSGTEDENGFFKKFFPDMFIYSGLDTENLAPMESLETRQKYAVKYLEKNGYNPWAVEVIDDCTHDPKFLKKSISQKIYKYGRHWRMLHILSLQYCLDIKPDIRACVDGVFIFRETNPDQRQKVWKNFGTGCTYPEFCDLLDQLTDDYTCIFINFRTQSNNMEDYVFFFKADLNSIPKDWKFGCKEMWNFMDERYNTNKEANPFA